jgi:signal transduction histidine kinase
MKYLFIGLTLIFAVAGLILYFNMFHFACVVSFLLSLAAGACFALFLFKQYKANIDKQEALRKRLTTDMAHELRTPLTAVGSHLEAMLTGIWDITPERLQGCYDEAQRLNALVADLEKLAKVESDNLKLGKTPEDLLEIASRAARNMSVEAEKKSQTLTVGGVKTIAPVDANRMVQIVTNLISNAIKYTPDGGHISVDVVSSGNKAVIRVTDDGIGIPDVELPLIFERFYRADKSRSRKTGGSGIGLTIARSIAHAHGGTITVESRENQGSCFTVFLPKK